MPLQNRQKLLARQNSYQVDVGTGVIEMWRELHLRTNQSGSHSPTNADTTTSDDEGFATHIPAQTTQTITLAGLLGYVNLANGVIDYGQQALIEWADTPGPLGIRKFRIVRPDGVGTCHTMWASASQTESGGALNDADKLSFQITRSGKPEVTQLGAPAGVPVPGVVTESDGGASIAYTATGTPSAVEVFVYEADTDEEVGWVVDTGGASPAALTGLTNGTDYYARLRSVTATGAISQLSVPSGVFTPSA